MRNNLLVFFIVLTAVGISFSNDYSFTITGELPTVKLAKPYDIFNQFEVDFGYQPKKRELNLKISPINVILSLTPPEMQKEVVYAPTKSITLIDFSSSPPEQLREEKTFFDQEKLILTHKPLKLTLVEQRTGGISVSLINRKGLKIPEIRYNTKARNYQVPPPPKTDSVTLKEERVYLSEDGIGYNPVKQTTENQSRISLGTVDLQEYRLGFSNPFIDALISNNTNRLFLKNDTLFIGAQASMDEITALASFPGFEFKVDLFDDNFVLRTITEFDRLRSFDFGLAMLNTTPLPVINWYTTGSGNLFSLGVDVFSRNSYGLGIRLSNSPYLIRGSTGYNFSNDAFHATIDGRYTFNKGLFAAALSYNDGISLNLGAQYQLIKNNPFSMNIYGNIDYCKDWLFSAGTKIRLGDVDLNIKIKFITGGLSVDVEAGYSF